MMPLGIRISAQNGQLQFGSCSLSTVAVTIQPDNTLYIRTREHAWAFGVK